MGAAAQTAAPKSLYTFAMRRSTRILGAVLILSALLTGLVWYAALREDRRGLLTVSFLDVGQGDAIFIEAPSGRQVLIDGGPGTVVLRRLSKNMPWWDRSIDVVVATHPDADHVGGLVDVLERYRIGAVIRSSVEGDTGISDALTAAVEEEAAEEITAARGQVVDLGGGAYLQILFPDRPVPGIDTNMGSVVARLVYGDTSFMLTGDAPVAIEEYLVALSTSSLKSTVLKAGHHGSDTSSSLSFIGYVDPEYAIFSRGCGNRYGHPAPEVVERFARFRIQTLDTCEEGTIAFVSNGQTVWRE